ncbi:hypothetical protein KKF05_04075 [Patescibacteria group bacterium]|nr:hypothetical protein [Patescibacteria group bacterium]MBU1029343.1 hypothetical protein [Patescibacteria group bacterium]MBU1916102.1 hypothetical protein [Patescibacteria group bacterium]
MHDSIIEKLHATALQLAELFGVEDKARDLIQDTLDLLNEESSFNQIVRNLSATETIEDLHILAAIWLALGSNHPAIRVFTIELDATGVQIETDLGRALWAEAKKRHPPIVVKSTTKRLLFTPESCSTQPVSEKPGEQEVDISLQAFISSARCNVIFLSFIDAALGDQESVEGLRSLLELIVSHHIFPIGFTDGDRTVIVVRMT